MPNTRSDHDRAMKPLGRSSADPLCERKRNEMDYATVE